MSDDSKKIPWGKIVKLFLEFLLAAVVAVFGSCSARSVRAGHFVYPSYFVKACVKCDALHQSQTEMSVQRMRAYLNPEQTFVCEDNWL